MAKITDEELIFDDSADERYRLQSFSKVWMVAEALEAENFAPKSQRRIQEITGLDKNFVFRALATLRLHGIAAPNKFGDWTFGPVMRRMTTGFSSLCMAALER